MNFQHNLVEVCGDKREAVFQLLSEDKQGETVTVPVSVHSASLVNSTVTYIAIVIFF